MTLQQRLVRIQNDLKVPKSKFNSFSKFNYRNVEDILEAVKPILLAQDVSLSLSDEIVLIGTRYYVKATASIQASAGDEREYISSIGFAREAESKKGMDDAQITGSASSYARKYALNGLFAIDDSEDIDSGNNKDHTPAPTQDKITAAQRKKIDLMMYDLNTSEYEVEEWLHASGLRKDLIDLNQKEADMVIGKMRQRIQEKKNKEGGA